jgi:hypothetical protein
MGVNNPESHKILLTDLSSYRRYFFGKYLYLSVSMHCTVCRHFVGQFALFGIQAFCRSVCTVRYAVILSVSLHCSVFRHFVGQFALFGIQEFCRSVCTFRYAGILSVSTHFSVCRHFVGQYALFGMQAFYRYYNK